MSAPSHRSDSAGSRTISSIFFTTLFSTSKFQSISATSRGQEELRDEDGLDGGDSDVLNPLSDPDSDREVVRLTLDQDVQGALGADDFPQETSLLGLYQHHVLAWLGLLDLESVFLQERDDVAP